MRRRAQPSPRRAGAPLVRHGPNGSASLGWFLPKTVGPRPPRLRERCEAPSFTCAAARPARGQAGRARRRSVMDQTATRTWDGLCRRGRSPSLSRGTPVDGELDGPAKLRGFRVVVTDTSQPRPCRWPCGTRLVASRQSLQGVRPRVLGLPWWRAGRRDGVRRRCRRFSGGSPVLWRHSPAGRSAEPIPGLLVLTFAGSWSPGMMTPPIATSASTQLGCRWSPLNSLVARRTNWFGRSRA